MWIVWLADDLQMIYMKWQALIFSEKNTKKKKKKKNQTKKQNVFCFTCD